MMPTHRPAGDHPTYYDAMGGHAAFAAIVRRFYARVAADAEFRAMYPEEDLGPAEERLRMFLEQYWGGPTTYSERRGHPRLRMRHLPFAVTPSARDTWLRHMTAAVEETAAEQGMDPQMKTILLDYLTRAADAMINTPEETQR